MLRIPGRLTATCEGVSRRDFLQVGSLGLMGMQLSQILALQETSQAATSRFAGAQGFGAAKSVVLLFLQGGPSHIDIWDPKPNAPSNVRGEFKPIKTKVPGIELSETMPKLGQAIDKATLIRSMSYTPAGLFNHTAAIYQMLTGYPPDKVSPSGQLEPPSPIDFPTAGSWISKFLPPTEPNRHTTTKFAFPLNVVISVLRTTLEKKMCNKKKMCKIKKYEVLPEGSEQPPQMSSLGSKSRTPSQALFPPK